MSNDIKAYNPSKVEYFSTSIQKQLSNFYDGTGLVITDKVKQRIVNGAREAYMVLQSVGIEPSQLDKNNVFTVFEQVAFLPVNPNAYPKQAYFSTRNAGDGKKILEYNVQGDGWETLLRVYGENLIRFKSIVIREGDYFGGIEYEGFEQKPPTIRLLTNEQIKEKGLDKKIRKVTEIVYMIETTYGFEYHVITREDVKANILAQAKNNGASPELIREMSGCSVDEILDPKGKWLDMKIKKTYVKNGMEIQSSYESNILSPTYRDESSREGMIITKMKKYLCNKFPKDFDKDPESKDKGVFIQKIYQNTLQEDRYDNDDDDVEITSEKIIENSDEEYNEKANKQDLNSNSEPLEREIIEEEVVETVVEEDDEPVEALEDDSQEEAVKENKVVEPQKEEPKQALKPSGNKEEDWM